MYRSILMAVLTFVSLSSFAAQNKDSITPFACIGAESGLGVARATYQCVSARGQHFVLAIGGLELSAILAANFSTGYAVGPIERGIYDLRLKAGVYKGVGGTVLSGGNLKLIGVGAGLGGQINFGVPADSLFGGQLVIE
ncbi:MAG: hypothetical protein H7061_09960 [Bdellovibrionaceae bacterium]|nr:hypothetical protein [Bdellovibrio sp.]